MTTERFNLGPRSRVTVEINDAKARRVFVKFAGEDAKKRAQRVLVAAKNEAPVGKGPTAGNLRSQIHLRQSRETTGQFSAGWDVSSDAPYSMFVIKGTRPHEIKGNPLLGFFWPKIGQFAVFHSVHHPGTKANNFLGRALRKAR